MNAAFEPRAGEPSGAYESAVADKLIREEFADLAHAPALAARICSNLVMDEDGRPSVVDRFGVVIADMTVAGLILDLKKASPDLFIQPTPAQRALAKAMPSPAKTRGHSTLKEIRELDRSERVAKASAVNPFSKTSWNVTNQVVLMKHDPALAARLQAKAG